MKELNKEEQKKMKAFIGVCIPKFIKEYSDNKIDMMECYEIGFMFAHDLLRNKKIDPSFSPWGSGSSLIFEPYFSQFLEDTLKSNLSDEINGFCTIFLDALEIFRHHI